MSAATWLFAQVYERGLQRAEQTYLADWRRALLAGLDGDVLEIGAGTGLNLPHYPAAVRRLVLAEPDPSMRKKLERRLRAHGRAAEVLPCTADSIPLPDASFDAVVTTLVLCMVPRQSDALSELRRVLKPGGKLVFLEHVAAVDNPRLMQWQERIEPVWKRVVAHCHLTRDTERAIWHAGFRIVSCERDRMKNTFPLVEPTIRGVAVKPAEVSA
jgi:ubiquinone/menaquinone biosynthesis C-methylase UbiE